MMPTSQRIAKIDRVFSTTNPSDVESTLMELIIMYFPQQVIYSSSTSSWHIPAVSLYDTFTVQVDNNWSTGGPWHDDVMTWKSYQYYLSFVKEINQSSVHSPKKM